MCGFFQFNVIKAFNDEMKRPPVLDKPDDLISGDFVPGSQISVIHEHEGETRTSTATWWLLLDRETLKPNYRYASFNSRSDKLDQPRAIAYQPYRESRCLIPATAFVEGLGDKKHYFKIELEESVICFGGVMRSWLNSETGELVYSASIITLPPLASWSNIHPKSFPLMLPADDEQMLRLWLDRSQQDVSVFNSLLEPRVRETQIVTPIQSARKLEAAGEPFEISAT